MNIELNFTLLVDTVLVENVKFRLSYKGNSETDLLKLRKTSYNQRHNRVWVLSK